MKVIHYDSVYYDDFIDFYKKIWPWKTVEYIRFRLIEFPENSGDEKCNLLVINDEGTIIGCNLYFPTRAKVNGEIIKIHWSHDTYILEKFRGDAGLLLLSEAFKLKSTFGVGLSEINYKIQKKIGANFLGFLNHYLLFNFWSVKLFIPFRKNFEKIPEKFIFPETLKTPRVTFKRITNASDLRIPENGFWNSDSCSIDFVRDYHFLQVRFFNNFRKYVFYKAIPQNPNDYDDCYFVIRPAYEGGYQILSVVDFRYNLKNSYQFDSVLKACSGLGRRNKVPLVTIKTSIKNKSMGFFPFFIVKTSKERIISYSQKVELNNAIITKADSDLDFITK